MSRFWKTVSRIDMRLPAMLSVACMLTVLAWKVRLDSDRNLTRQPLRNTRTEHVAGTAPSLPSGQPEPELKKNPFMSSYLEHLRAVAKEEREVEMARRRAEADARRAKEEAAKLAAEAESNRKAAEGMNDGEQDLASSKKEAVDSSVVDQTNAAPRAMTLLYKGMLVRTDGVRLALIALNGEEGYYPEGQTLEWITIRTFSRESLELRLGDDTVVLQRGQSFSTKEPRS